MLATMPQKSSGFSVSTCGPGVTLCMIIAASISVITAVPGMPRVSVGMNEVWAAALFAASGEATPSIAPALKRAGSRAIFFSSVYAANEDSAGPVPGRRPKNAPTPGPRSAGQNAAFKSRALGISCATLPVNAACGTGLSRFMTISATANRPTARTVKPMPSVSSGTSKS